MRNSIYRYFDDEDWAEAFLDGKLRFKPLSHFHRIEDLARKDLGEGRLSHRPLTGLEIAKQPDGETVAMPGYDFRAEVQADGIYILSTSRVLSDRLWDRYSSKAVVEVRQVRPFHARIKQALPVQAVTRISRVDYRLAEDVVGIDWAFPDRIASQKNRAAFELEQETRAIFSVSGALDFQQATYKLTTEPLRPDTVVPTCEFWDLDIGSIRDICCIIKSRSK